MRGVRFADTPAWISGFRKLGDRIFQAGETGQLVGRRKMQSQNVVDPDWAHRGPGNEGLRGPQIRGELPTFLAKAQEDAELRRALARMGYRRVLATYLRQTKRSVGTGAFFGLAQEGLSPSLEFVGDWLKEEKRRIRAQVRSTFVVAMLSALGAGLAFGLALMILR